jgi:hypothetical protein
MSIKIKIGSMVFSTKAKAEAYYKGIFSSYSDGQDVGSKDFEELCKLIEKHPNSVGKVGNGIKRIFRGKTQHGASCFWIERMDGTKVDFSSLKCIDAAGESGGGSAPATDSNATST